METIHLILLGAWAGLVAAETVLELSARDESSRKHAARVHFLLDVTVEVPLLVGVLGSGIWLLAEAWPPSPLLVAKVGAALVAIGANLYCVGVVVLRARRVADDRSVRRLSRHVRYSGLGAPFALVAAYLGIRYFAG